MEKILFKNDPDFPSLLQQIPDPPEKLYIKGKLPDKDAKILCIVGARKYSSYGKEAVEKLVSGLRGYNICIVSGLALGIDSIAHRSAIDARLQTIAFPGSGLHPSALYPAAHARLAEEIIKEGGALLSELEPTQGGAIWTFPQRNRLMAGISHATLVIEARLESGTLITSKFATDYNRDVGAVPGQIFSPLSAGPHMLIRLGATPVTCPDDILEMLHFARRDVKGESENSNGDDGGNRNNCQNFLPFQNSRLDSLLKNLDDHERKIIHLLQIEPRTKDVLIRELGIDARSANTIISSLEIEGLIKEEGGVVRMG